MGFINKSHSLYCKQQLVVLVLFVIVHKPQIIFPLAKSKIQQEYYSIRFEHPYKFRVRRYALSIKKAPFKILVYVECVDEFLICNITFAANMMSSGHL